MEEEEEDSQRSGQMKKPTRYFIVGSVDAIKKENGLGCLYVTTPLLLHSFPPAS